MINDNLSKNTSARKNMVSSSLINVKIKFICILRKGGRGAGMAIQVVCRSG